MFCEEEEGGGVGRKGERCSKGEVPSAGCVVGRGGAMEGGGVWEGREEEGGGRGRGRRCEDGSRYGWDNACEDCITLSVKSTPTLVSFDDNNASCGSSKEWDPDTDTAWESTRGEPL